jgi:hypothetical protein
MPKQPKSVKLHDNSRPLLGPEPKGTSEQEPRLGLPPKNAPTKTRPNDIRVAVQNHPPMRSTSDQRLARRARASQNRPAISAVRNTTSMLGIAKRSPASVPNAPTMIISTAPRAALRDTRDGVQRSNRLARCGSSDSRHCSIAARRRRSWWLSIAPRFAPGRRSQPGSLPAATPARSPRASLSPTSRPTFGAVSDRQIILGARQDRAITLNGRPRSSGAGLCGPRCPCPRRCALPSWTCSTHPESNCGQVRCGARAEIRRQVWTLIEAATGGTCHHGGRYRPRFDDHDRR